MSELSFKDQPARLTRATDILQRLPRNLYNRAYGLIYGITCLPAILVHRFRSRVIAGPGFLGFGGGLYNPGSVITEDNEVVLLARGQSVHWMDCRGSKARRFLEGAPALITLNRDLEMKSHHVMGSHHGFPPFENMGIEDFRLFRFGGEIWAVHGLLRFRIHHGRPKTFEAVQTLAILDPTQKTLTRIGNPRLDFAINKIEKNWVFVEFQGELYLFYSFQPYRVLKLQDRETLRFTTFVDRDLGPKLNDNFGQDTMISFSTNPIEYDSRYFMVIVHQIKYRNNRHSKLYGQWGVLIDKDSMLPKKITAAPLFTGKGARGKLRTTLYVMSVLRLDDDFIFFNGEGDSYLSHVTISGSKLEKLWREFPI